MDLDEVPPPPAVRAPTLPSLVEAEGYPPHGRAHPSPELPMGLCSLQGFWAHPTVCPPDTDFGEHRTQKGLDRYLDSLFDPVLSYGNGVSGVPLPEGQQSQGMGHSAASVVGLCLSFPRTSGHQELEKPAAIVQRMKGSGGVGGGDKSSGAKQQQPAVPVDTRQPRGELLGPSLSPCLLFPT